MLISQIRDANWTDHRRRARSRAAKPARSRMPASVYALAMEAADSGKSLADVIEAHGLGDVVDLEKAVTKAASCRRSPIPMPRTCI